MENIDYVEEKYMPDSIEDVDIINAHTFLLLMKNKFLLLFYYLS